MPARLLGQEPLEGLPTYAAPKSQQRSVRALEGALVYLVHFHACTCKSRIMDTLSSASFVVEKPFGDPPGYSNFGNISFGRPGRIFHGCPRHSDTLLIQQRVGIDTLSFDESFSCRNQHALGSKLNALRKDPRALLNIWNQHIFNHGDRTDYPTDQ